MESRLFCRTDKGYPATQNLVPIGVRAAPGVFMTKLLRLSLCLVVAMLPFAAIAAERVALVVGNQNYEFTTKLKNTANDATAISTALTNLSFDVTTLIDPSQADLLVALSSFAFRAETADVAMVYYAGHAIEVQGENFLIPVDARIASGKDVLRYTVSLTDVLNSVYGARKIRIAILDSCRNNPLQEVLAIDPLKERIDTAGTSKIKSGAESVRGIGGLAPVTPTRGTLVAYSQRPGEVAEDGLGANSPFAVALLNALAQPDLEIGMLFRFVRDDVLEETQQRQEPYVNGSLSKDLYYFSGTPEELAANKVEDQRVAWSSPRPELAAQLRAQADQGDTRSMVGIAYKNLNPDGQEYDPQSAASLLMKAADKGDPEAQFELAKLYETGVGVAQDPVRALALYRASADQDFADAINDLGFLTYQGGLGLTSDPALALKLFERAADLKHPEAMYNFAALIDDGAVAGKGPADAAEYLYLSLRAGTRSVFDLLRDKPDMFKPETRKALQARLAEVKLYAGTIDGDFGAGTQRSIRLAYGLTE